MTTMKISVPSTELRLGWKTMADVKKFTGWTEAELVEVCQRYCDMQDRAKKYRVGKQEEFKLLKAKVEAMEKAQQEAQQEGGGQ